MNTFHQLQYHFPFLFSKYIRLVYIEVPVPMRLLSNTLSSYSKLGGKSINILQKCTHTFIILDILYLITLDPSLSTQLLTKYNVIPVLFFLQAECIVSRFLYFLKSDSVSSFGVIDQLKHTFPMKYDPIFIKQCVSLLKYIHVSVISTYIATMNDIFSVSR